MEPDDVTGNAAFALGPDGLPGIRFDEGRRHEYERICDDLIQRALEEHHAFHSSSLMDHRWKLVRQRDALSVYRHRTPVPPLQPDLVAGGVHTASSTRSSLMMGSGFLPGTLNDTMLGVYCDTTETMRIVKSILSDKFIDGAMVHVFEKNSIRAPIIFSGIKWFALQCPGGQLTHDRDVLCYERMGRIVDTDGNYFAYHTLQSIDLPEWPANRATLRRAYLSMCYLYRQVNEHWVGTFMMGDFDTASSVPSSIVDLVVSDMMLSVGNVLECAQAKRFSMLMLQNANTNPPSYERHCSICLATPGVFSSVDKAMQLCVGCHKRVCKRCRLSCKVFRLSMRSRRPKKEWFCRECVGQVVVGPPRRNDWAEKENDVPNADYSPASNADSVRSEQQDGKLHERDMDALAELAQQWSIQDNRDNGLMWNAEELARLSGRLSTSKGNKSAGAGGSKRFSAAASSSATATVDHVPSAAASPKGMSRSFINGLGLGGAKSILPPFLKRSSSQENLHSASEPTERRDPNFVPGNSYSGGTSDWRTRAARLNASISHGRSGGAPPPSSSSSSSSPSTAATTPSSTVTPSSSTRYPSSTPRRKNSTASSNASSITSSNASSSRRRGSRRPPSKLQNDEEMKRLYVQFMETMAKNRQEASGQQQQHHHYRGEGGGGGAGGREDPILQSKLVFDPERNEYVRVPLDGSRRVPSPRDKCFSIDELD